MLRTVRVLAEHEPVRTEMAREEGPDAVDLVVVKRLRGFRPTLARRLAREAEVVSKLDHPTVLERGPLPPECVVHVAKPILDALACNIIHNDVNPANLLIGGERAVLLDFGFAKNLSLAAITSVETAMGTPNDMTPEPFAGRRDAPRSDPYAVAAITDHALQAHPPYARNVHRMLAGDDDLPRFMPPDPSSHVRAWLPRALAHHPEDQFPDALAMRQALAIVPEPPRTVPA